MFFEKGIGVKTILGVLALVLPLAAQAGFFVEDGVGPAPAKTEKKVEKKEPKEAPAPVAPAAALPVAAAAPLKDNVAVVPMAKGEVLSSVTYVGMPDKEPPVLQGFGSDVKLVDAIRRVVPSEWNVFWKEEAIRKNVREAKVNWSDGRSWIELLNGFGIDYGLQFEVDWGRKHVYVGEKKGVQGAAIAAAAAAAPPVWSFKAGDSLRKTLAGWTQRAGWSFIWSLPDSEDLTLRVGNTYTTDFKSAVRSLFNSIPSSPETDQIRVQFRNRNDPPLLFITNDQGAR